MAFAPTDPVTAREISLHTTAVLEQIRLCETLGQIDELHRGYVAYAERMGVAPQIREHVRAAGNEVAITIEAKRKMAAKAQHETVVPRIIGEGREVA